MLALATSAAWALDPTRLLTQYTHDSWGAEEGGLPQSSIMSAALSPDGYLWLGTQEGLVRFDGERFRSFAAVTGSSLPGDQVLALAFDPAGALWVGTEKGVARWQGGTLHIWRSQDGLPDDVVYALTASPDGTIWVGTHGGLGRCAADRCTTVAGDALGVVYALLVDRTGTLWIGTAARGVHRLDPRANAALLAPVGPRDRGVSGLAQQAGGTIWASLRSGGLLEFDGQRTRLWNKASGLASDDLTAVAVDRDDRVWVGAADGSLSRLHGDRFESSSGSAFGNTVINVLLEDRERDLWVGTDGGGLHRLHEGEVAPFGKPEGLSDEVALAVLPRRAGGLWVGTHNTGLSAVHDGQVDGFGGRRGVPDAPVLTLFENRAGVLWFGTEGRGLCRRDAAGTATCALVGSGLGKGTVSGVIEDRRGRIWVGTPEGLYTLDGPPWGGSLRAGQSFVHVQPSGPLAEAFVLVLYEAPAGDLYAGTYGRGLWRARDGGDSTWERIALPVEANVTALLEDADGTLWAASAGQGLLRRRAGQWAVFGANEGLPEQTLFTVLDDGQGNLWLSSNRGLLRVARSELDGAPRPGGVHARRFDRADGMRVRECNGGTQPAAAVDAAGRLWFPTMAGLVTIDPGRALPPAPAPTVRIEEVLLDQRPQRLGSELVVPAGTDRAEFRFTAPALAHPGRLRFRHRLDGHDPEWIDAGTRRLAFYGRLTPGSYRLEVQALPETGPPAPPSMLDIEVQPLWHETWAFRAGAALVLAAFIALLYRLRVRSLKVRELRLADEVELRTRELAEVNDRLQTANRELERLSATDSLTGLANRRRFEESLGDEWRRAARENDALAAIVMDIDVFKAYNDAYGHPAGDECLRRVAAVVARGARRAGEIAARLGGEEFAVLLPGSDEAEALELAERLRTAIAELAIPHLAATDGRVTASFGVAASAPRPDSPPATLMARADRALYRAKQSGRNRVAAASDELHPPAGGPL